jgi:hypothetical protein
MQKCLQSPRSSACGLFRILSFYSLAHIYLIKKPPKCCTILVWIAGCWNSSNTLSKEPVLLPEPVFVNLIRSPGIDSQPGGPVRRPYLSYRPARLHWLSESIPRSVTGLHKHLQIRPQRKGSAALYLEGGRGGRAWSLLGWAGRTEEARRWVGVVTSWEGVSIRS